MPSDKFISYGCDPLEWLDFMDEDALELDLERTETPRDEMMRFVMVKRGMCSNVTKVRNI